MQSESESDDEMAPDIVTDQNGRKTESYRSRFQHCPVPRNLKKESERLKTFINWTVSFLDSKKLAKEGFYYTNTEDVVKCAFCDVQIGCWKQGDDPKQDHQSASPDCPFLGGLNCGNQVQSDVGEDNEEEEEADVEESREGEVMSQDVCGSYGLEIRPFSGPERPGKTPFAIESSNLWRDFEELGVSKISGPVAPHYATLNSRIKSFENWPIPEIQLPEKLAEAGFYYTSYEDNVLCFHCGGGLKNWEAEDDPWVEHALWFCRCGFVILRKGREFISEILAKEKQKLAELVRRASFCTRAECQALQSFVLGDSFQGLNGLRSEYEKSQEKSCEPQEKKAKDARPTTPVAMPPAATPPASSTSSSNKESQVSQSTNSEGKEIELCRICYVRERGIVFLPCGHFVSCTQCAPSLSTCAVCRKPFEATVRAYLS